MRCRKRFLLIILPLCLSLTVTGCGLQDLLGNKKKPVTKTSSQDSKKEVIAVVLSEDNPNRFLIQKGIEDMAKKGSVEVKYLSESGEELQSPSGGNDSGSQKSGSKSGSEDSEQKSPLEGAKVLIYQGASSSVIQDAEKKSIPVLALGNLPNGTKPVGIVLPDPEKTGELMAEALTKKIQEGNIVILQQNPDDTTSQEILAGNRVILSRYPKIITQVITSPAGTESVAKQALMEYLTKNPDKVQGVLAHTEELAAQASEVIKQNQLDKKIDLIGGQANIASLQRMSGGGQTADVDTSPYLQGISAIQWAQSLVNKDSPQINDSVTSADGEIPAKVVPVKAVTRENFTVIQKSYTTALEAEQQSSKEKTASSNQAGDKSQGQSGQASGQNSGEGNSGGSTGSTGSSSGSTGGQGGIPPGVVKVTERIKTEITREYLDSQGKVIGTEKSANEQVKTVPPEMLEKAQQKEQQSQGQQSQGGKGSQGGQGDQSGGGQSQSS